MKSIFRLQRKTTKKKTWLIIGDSISEHNFRVKNGRNYDYYAARKLQCKVINVAASGTGYITEYEGTKSWLDRIPEFPKDVDFITVFGALNDRGKVVGNFEDDQTDTLYGGLHIFYRKLIAKYPNKPIGVITSTPRGYCWGETGQYVDHINAVIRVARHYSLPVLDLYSSSGLRPWNRKNNKELFSCSYSPSGDGVHLNEKGHQAIANKIYNFIKSELLY